MQIPSTVRVLGKTYRVIIGQQDFELAMERLWGRALHNKGEIHLRSDLAPDQRQEAFLHELVHCAEAATVSDNVSEQIVYGISAALFAIFRDNGWWPTDAEDPTWPTGIIQSLLTVLEDFHAFNREEIVDRMRVASEYVRTHPFLPRGPAL